MTVTNLQRFDLATPIGSLGNYIHWVNQIPLLSLEEEQQLATRLLEHNDLDAARRLVMAHLRFVVKIARGYAGYGLPQADLIQEGNIGLMKAVKRFNPQVGVRLVSFAVHWIRAEIHEYIIKNWRIVKIATTKAQRKLFFNLRKAAKKLGWFSEEEAQAVAMELNVTVKDVRQMEARLSHYDASIDLDESDDDAHHPGSIARFLEDKRQDPAQQLENHDWQQQQVDALHVALDELNERDRDIIESRWLATKKATLHDLAAKYQISAERVRQLEKNAMTKLRHVIN